MRKAVRASLATFTGLLIVQVVAAILWHLIGFQHAVGHVVGLIVFLVEGVVLPVRVTRFISTEGRALRAATLLVLSLLLLANFLIQNYVWMNVSGYQAVVRDGGGGFAQFLVLVQWAVATLFLWMSHNMWRQDRQGVKERR